MYCGTAALKPLEMDSGLQCQSCGECVYINSKPSVLGAISADSKVLLVSDHTDGRSWGLPGGFLNHGEDPAKGLRREIKEELDIEVEIGKLIDAKISPYGDKGEFSLILFYLIEKYDANFKASNEISHVKWFAFDDLPNFNSSEVKELTITLPDLMENS